MTRKLLPKYHLLGGALSLLLLLMSCGSEKKGKEFKLAHGLDVNHPVHKAMEHLGEKLTEISDGELSLKIYPSQQLGSERECLELLQLGSVDITKVSAAVLENFVPDMGVLSIPYAFSDKSHAHRVYDGPLGEELLKSCYPQHFRGLCFYDAGSRSFYTKDRAVHSPADLKGLKIRVQESITAINMVRSMGGSPTPISWGELYTALQQGVVDGAENNPPSFYLSRHYEVCRYYSLDEHTLVPDVLLISLKTWNDLNQQEKNWLKEAVRSSVKLQRKLWEESEEKALAEVEKAGVTIIIPDKSVFKQAIAGMFQAYRQDSLIDYYLNQVALYDH